LKNIKKYKNNIKLFFNYFIILLLLNIIKFKNYNKYDY